jgi:hypothetical protein
MDAAADRTTAKMEALQLHQLLLPERSTVILLTERKAKDYFRSAVALYCAVAIVLFLVGLLIAI